MNNRQILFPNPAKRKARSDFAVGTNQYKKRSRRKVKPYLAILSLVVMLITALYLNIVAEYETAQIQASEVSLEKAEVAGESAQVIPVAPDDQRFEEFMKKQVEINQMTIQYMNEQSRIEWAQRMKAIIEE